MSGALKPWPEFYRERLAALPADLKHPDRGYPWAYGAAGQIAENAILQLEFATKEIAALRRRPDRFECPCCGADGENFGLMMERAREPGEWHECRACECQWSETLRRTSL